MCWSIVDRWVGFIGRGVVGGKVGLRWGGVVYKKLDM